MTEDKAPYEVGSVEVVLTIGAVSFTRDTESGTVFLKSVRGGEKHRLSEQEIATLVHFMTVSFESDPDPEGELEGAPAAFLVREAGEAG